MNEQTKDSAPGSNGPAPELISAHAESREQVQQRVRRALERASRAGMRAAVVMVEVNPDYAGRAPERLERILEKWRQRRTERFDAEILGATKALLAIAPIALPAHGRSLAERFTRELDPRICPLLARALPYAWCGVSLYPDDAIDPPTLILCAERGLEGARGAERRSRISVFARRRHAAAAVLGPAAVRRASVES